MVRPYDETDKTPYPHLLLMCNKLDMYRLNTLKGMLISAQTSVVPENSMAVVMKTVAGSSHIGYISNITLKTLIGNKVFSTFDKRIYVSPDEFYEGDMLYAFCGTSY